MGSIGSTVGTSGTGGVGGISPCIRKGLRGEESNEHFVSAEDDMHQQPGDLYAGEQLGRVVEEDAIGMQLDSGEGAL